MRGTLLLPPPCWALRGTKLLLPAQSNSINVRDSPQAVGVRVSTLSRDWSMPDEKTPLPREWLADCATEPRPGMKTWPRGIAFRFPFCPELVVGVPGFELLAPFRK